MLGPKDGEILDIPEKCFPYFLVPVFNKNYLKDYVIEQIEEPTSIFTFARYEAGNYNNEGILEMWYRE